MNTLGEPKPIGAGLSEAQENYLKQILILEGVDSILAKSADSASTQALAEHMGVRPASVTGMLKKLAALKLVEHTPYHGVRLTDAGFKIALEILRHHRLIEAYLSRRLGYAWNDVHEEAEQLEHVISEAFETRIDEVLDYPSYDPHGDPIPSENLLFPTVHEHRPLSDLKSGEAGIILRVTAQDADTLNLLTHLRLVPGSRVSLLEHTPSGLRVRVGKESFLLPLSLAQVLQIGREGVRA